MKKIPLYMTLRQSIISLCLCASVVILFCTTAFAVTETTQSYLSGNAITASSTITVEDQWFAYMQDHPSTWQDRFAVKEVNDLVILRFDDTKKEYFASSWNLTVHYDIILTYSDFTTDTIEDDSIHINYSPTATYSDIAIKRYLGAHKVELSINSVTSDTIVPDMHLDVQLNVERYYSFPLSLLWELEGDTIEDNQFQMDWNYIIGAEYYELEYLFVDMLEEPTTTHKAFDFRNATRITTSNTYYNLSLAYPKGALIYRVRAVGYLLDDFSVRKYSDWSYDPDISDVIGRGYTDEVPNNETGPDYIFSYPGLIDSLNWQYTVNYAEEGKRKEVLSFADGSLRNRLSVTIANTDSNAIVSAPVYDHQGRQAVQVLPVPLESEGLKYYKASSTLDMNGGFNRSNFDTDTKLNSPDSLPSLSAARIYYSPSNPDKTGADAYIPRAGGYAYAQTVFKNDGTNRPKKQTTVGKEYKSGSGYETKYYYGAPSGQIELDRLFGSEVGYVEHYQKNMVKDPNGQVSVSYIDQHGRTVATALAGAAPANLTAIDGKPAADTITANLLAPNEKKGQYEMHSSKVITVSSPSAFHFEYDFSDTTFCDQDTCLPCQDCIYDLVITVTNEDGDILYNSTEENNDTVVIINSTTDNHYEFTLSSGIMQIGTYTVNKTLRLNAASLATLDSLFMEEQVCVPYDSIDPDPCFIDCESLCAQNYTRTDADGNTYYVDDEENVYENIEDVQALIDSCIANTCENHYEGGIDMCTLKKNMMKADVSPGGQYFDNTPDQLVFSGGSWVPNAGYDQDEWLNAHNIPSAIYSQYNNWEDVRLYWEDSWAEEMLEIHPEICAYQYYCEYNPSLSCLSDTSFEDYREYDKFFTSINDSAIANSASFYLFNPIGYTGTATSNGEADDNSTYINFSAPTTTYRDPFFACNTAARDSMIYHLTHFVERDNGTGDYYSIWYVLQDPDDIANNYYAGVDSTVHDLFSSLHNGLFDTSGVDKFQFFKGIYSYFKQSIIAQQYYNWHDGNCELADGYYYLTDTTGTGVDTAGFQIRFPYNPILEFNLAALDSMFNQGEEQFNEQCAQNCELHADNWMQQLEGCYDQPDSVAIRTLLIDICSAACDMSAAPFGSSVIADPDDYISVVISGNLETFGSFEDVTDFYGTACPLIAYPEEYDQADCSCESYYAYLDLVDLVNTEYTNIAAKLLGLTGLTFNTSDISTWRTQCNSSTPSETALISANFPELFWCTAPSAPEDNVDSLMAAIQQACEDQALLAALYKSDKQYQENLQEAKDDYLEAYAKACFGNIEDRETFEVTYVLDEYLYTLYYFDQAANLVKTVSPKGVDLIEDEDTLAMIDEYRRKDSTDRFLPSHDMITQYTYNSLNQLRRQNSPDGGTTFYWYDEIGRIRASQNAKQKEEDAYSYTSYDDLSRIIETGEIKNVTDWDTTLSFITEADYTTWLASSADTSQITHTYYDSTAFTISGFTQENLQGRISSITIDEEGDGFYEFASHFSYDEHGNVKSLIQENNLLSTVDPVQQYKQIDYEYDLLNGNVKAVHYQQGELDQLSHYYQYDADNRLTHVFLSDNDFLLNTALENTISNFDLGTLNQKLFYYKHGPLMRDELGDKQVQGSDYAYTLQGWLKAVNSATLKTKRDIGQDGATNNQQPTTNNYFAQDALGFSLRYNSTDYTAIASISQDNYALATNNAANNTALFNGNISEMLTHFIDNNEAAVQLQAESYNYDQLNRIKTAKVYTAKDFWNNDDIATNNSLVNATDHNDYKNTYKYDFNGNITSNIRHGAITNIKMDSLLYYYSWGKNQLNYVAENATSAYSTNYTNDIDTNQSSNNYLYDAIGNLVKDKQEEIDTIIWNLQGKVKEIIRVDTSSKPDLVFYYDAMGNRIGKLEKPRNGSGVEAQDAWTFTWYVNDASGNVMATYQQSYQLYGDETLLEYLNLQDHALYSSKRIGLKPSNLVMTVNGYIDFNFNVDGTLNVYSQLDPLYMDQQPDSIDTLNYSRELGIKRYELTDHLGNVRSVISDRKLAVNELVVLEENFNNSTTTWTKYEPVPSQPVTTSITSGMMYVETKGQLNGVYKKFPCLSGKSYSVRFKADKVTGQGIAVATHKSGSPNLGNSGNLSSDGTYSFTFTATTDSFRLYFVKPTSTGTNSVFNYDDITVFLLDTLGSYKADVVSVSDYYPFGMQKPGRVFASGEYKYGFNDKLKDDELKGEGNSYDFGARIYDPRIAKWLSIDPYQINYPGWSSYNYVRGNPILRVDIGGNWDVEVHAYNDRAKFGYGIAILKDRNGKEIARYTCKMVGTHRDRTTTNGDTPTGTYSIGDWKGVWAEMDNDCAYGYNDVLRLTAIEGEFDDAGDNRQGILFHGGRQTDDCDDASWIEDDEPLQYTYGCFRFFDEDMADMKSLTEDLEANDALETPGNVTLTNDLIVNANFNYSIPKDLENTTNCSKGDLMKCLITSTNKADIQKSLNQFKKFTCYDTYDSKEAIKETEIKSDYSNIQPRNTD